MEDNKLFEKQNQFALFVRLLKYIIPYWDKYILIIVLLIIQGTISALPVLLLSKLPSFIGQGQSGDYLFFCFLLLLPAFLFRWIIFDSLLYTLVWYLGLKLSLKLRLDLYRRLQLLSLKFYQSRPIGEHMYRANADIDALLPLLNSTQSGLPGFISNIYQTILMIYLVSVVGSNILFYLTLILIPIYFLVHILYSRIQKLDYIKRVRAQEVDAVLRESLAGIRVIKAFDRVKFTTRRYYSVMKKFYKSTQAAFLLQYLVADQVRVIPVHIIWPLSLPLFAYFGLKGAIPIITWGSIIYFSRLLLYFLDGTYNFVQRFRLFLIPAKRLFETLDQQPDIVESANARRIDSLKGAVEFDSVNFSYQRDFPILKNISFQLKPGQKLGIVGPSGAGKSTIAMLVLRLFEPDSGAVKIDGLNVKDVNMASVLEQTGVILQDTFLFGGTIRENIRYGDPYASDEQVEQAARAAGIHADILEMPGGYDMDVAEGTNLSGGQKQRVAIARALLKNPALLLLDEATSSLDIETENGIMQTLRQNFSHVSTIIISHRLSFVADAAHILVVDKGEIVEQGAHAQLIQNKKLYYQLYQQQSRSTLTV
ncbi:MAG: ABC transporter ATP-binding protein [Candidatus Zhuqueibacterota bacterium]